MVLPFAGQVLQLLEEHRYLALFVLLLLEESGVPLPLPGDSVMMFAGYSVSTARISFLPAFVCMEVATLIGASILRWIGQRGGRPLILRYGHYVHLDEQKLARVEAWFVQRGSTAILLGRLIPGLRMPTSLISGIFAIPYPIFLLNVAIGSSLYILFFMALGIVLGDNTRWIVSRLWPHHLFLGLAAVVIAVATVLIVWLRRRTHRSLG
ncbi:MAG: DedA family protein [Chloroflexota bacterium]|nr:MAG: DedA family protein [Chloroflexota bacterium]